MKRKIKTISILAYPIILLLIIVFVFAHQRVSGGGGWLTGIIGHRSTLEGGVTLGPAFDVNDFLRLIATIIPIFIAVLLIVNGFILKWRHQIIQQKIAYLIYAAIVASSEWLLPQLFFQHLA